MTETEALRIVPLEREHLDQILRVERASFTDPWTRGMFESELDIEARGYARGAMRHRHLVGYLFAILIPDGAVVTDQSRKLVMTVKEDGTVEPKVVRPGPMTDDGLRQAAEVNPGDKFELVITANRPAPNIPTGGKLELLS